MTQLEMFSWPWQHQPDEWVYVVQARRSGLVKIGRAGPGRLEARIGELNRRYYVRVIEFFPGGAPLERSLHRRFDRYHAYGEWFRYEGELQEWIIELLLRRRRDQGDQAA